jgi:glycosyltransferase involved in cell wall biosynthesis
MHISVIVPFHNCARFIEACVKALISQRYPRDSFEIFMVDNNSVDASAEIVRRYPEVRLLSETKPGAYAARNRAARDASGAIIAFTDSDCAPAPDWLQTISDAMAAPGVCLVQGRQRFASESLGLSSLADYETVKAAYTLSSGRKEIYYGYTNNMAVRRDVFDAVGPFEEIMRGADSLFVHRVLNTYSCAAVRFVPGMYVQHLEVTSIWTWFRKINIYGRSFRRYSHLAQRRSLSRQDRWRVIRATIRNNRYSPWRSMVLLGLLSIGMVSYELGRRVR